MLLSEPLAPSAPTRVPPPLAPPLLAPPPLAPPLLAPVAGPRRAGGPVLGYVVKSYPRFSETFVVRELVAREEAGERAVVASLRPPRDPRFHALLARVQAPVTYVPDDVRGGLVRLWDGWGALRAAGVVPSRRALDALLDEEPGVAAQAVGVARWAVETGVTHLHAHFASLPGRTTRLAALLTGLPWTVTAHAKDVFHDDVDPRRLAAVMADADGVVAVSDMTTAWLAERHPAARLHRVHNGLDLDELTWSSPARRPAVVAAVGRIVPKKGFDVLLDAVALLRGRGVDVRLRLAGAGDGGADLAAQVVRLGLEDVVELLGPLPQHDVVASCAAPPSSRPPASSPTTATATACPPSSSSRSPWGRPWSRRRSPASPRPSSTASRGSSCPSATPRPSPTPCSGCSRTATSASGSRGPGARTWSSASTCVSRPRRCGRSPRTSPRPAPAPRRPAPRRPAPRRPAPRRPAPRRPAPRRPAPRRPAPRRPAPWRPRPRPPPARPAR
ncbi:glycosyltransferase [Pseudokineococcus sp. 5B2Z-1]|uniref:glycosyltransferase family 4 protein n=1 Tax=Pseudokineococcus sp. 5B2Z-1 TaxID=3132744 RepID=UPI0030AB8012